jgi:thiamine biosynthesis lipoprotein ApbE
VLIQRYERIMATQVGAQVAAPDAEAEEALAAITACLTWMGKVERRLSRFAPESDLSRLNAARAACGRPSRRCSSR